jgi:hypothetical protein
MFGNEVQPILITSPTADHVCITTSSDSDYNAQVVFKYYGSDYNITPKPKPQSPLHIKRLGFVQGQTGLSCPLD